MASTIPVPRIETTEPRIADIPQASFGNGAARDMEQMTQTFLGASRQADTVLDRIAVLEGEKEGALAGQSSDFRPVEDGTIRGEAYDRAAIRSYLSTMKLNVLKDITDIWNHYRDDPEALDSALKTLKTGYDQNLFDAVKPDFDNLFAEQHQSLMAEAGRLSEARVRDADVANTTALVEARSKALERMATFAGNDVQAAEMLDRGLKDLEGTLIEHGPRGAFEFNGVSYPADPARTGALSLEGIQKVLLSTKDNATEARVMGKFERLGANGAAKEQFIQSFEGDYYKPDTGEFTGTPTTGLSMEQVERLSARMRASLARDKTAGSAAQGRVKDAVENVVDLLEKGYSPGEENLKGLLAEAAARGDEKTVQKISDAYDSFALQGAWRVMPPAQLESQINAERARLSKAAEVDPKAVKRVELAEKVLGNMRETLDRDPLAWGARTGLIDGQPIALVDSDGVSAASTMSARKADAEAVAQHFGVPAQYLTESEQTALKTAAETGDPQTIKTVAYSISKGFGPAAPKVFGQVSKDAPLFAHVGGLMSMGAQPSTIDDLVEGLNLIRQDKNTSPTDQEIGTRMMDSGAQEALSFLPETRQAVGQSAAAIFAARAARLGAAKPEGGWKENGGFDGTVDKAIDESLGAVFVNGKKFGGLGTVNGVSLVVPSGVKADGFEKVLRSLTPEEWKKMGNGWPVDYLGREIPVNDVKDYYPVSVGAGRYMLSTTDPTKVEPVFVKGDGPGGWFVIDFERVRADASKARPGDVWKTGGAP